MSSLGFSASALTAVLVAATGGMLAGAGPVPGATPERIHDGPLLLNPVNAFGLVHTELGGASLSAVAGQLVVSNIGSSGLDGVRIDVGHVTGHSIRLDAGEMGNLAAGACVLYYKDLGGDCIYIQEESAGSAALSYDASGKIPDSITVSVYDAGTLVDEGVVDFGDFVGQSARLVSGDMGSDPATGESMTLNYQQVHWTYDYRVRLPRATPLQIEGSPAGPVVGDEVRLSVHGLPPGELTPGSMAVFAANMPGGVLTITGEALRDRKGTKSGTLRVFGDGDLYSTSGSSIISIGGALMAGVDDPCLGLPENCESLTFDPLDPPSALRVSNLGSSGCDGVRFDFDDPCDEGEFQCADGSCTLDPTSCNPAALADRVFTVTPLDPDADGDRVHLNAIGQVAGGVSGSPLGDCLILNVAGSLQLFADFSPIGSDIVRVEVYDRGQLSGSYDVVSQVGLPLGTIVPDAAGLNINKCGKLGDLLGPPCFFACTEAPFTLLGGGQVLVGDDLRVLAVSAPDPIVSIDAFELMGQGLDDFTVRQQGTLSPEDVGVHQGHRVHAEDNARLSTSPDGHLVVSNLGSSGCDGVSIDLGDSEGGLIRFASGGEFTVDSFFDITYRVSDETCPTCPDVVQYGWLLEATTPNEVFIGNSPLAPQTPTDVRLYDDLGNLIAQFPTSPGQRMKGDSTLGDIVVVRELDKSSTKLQDVSSGGPPDATNIVFERASDGGTISVTDPGTGITYPGVRTVGLYPQGASTASCCYGKVTILKRALVPPMDFTLEKIMARSAGLNHTGLGNARLGTHNWIGTPARSRLYVSNIGSSGQDGVRIDLGSQWCDGLDDDCDGIPDDVPDSARFSFETLDPASSVQRLGFRAESDWPDDWCIIVELAEDAAGIGTDVGVAMGDSVGGSYQFQVTVNVLDAAGNVLATEPGSSHPVCTDSCPGLVTVAGDKKKRLSLSGAWKADWGQALSGGVSVQTLTEVTHRLEFDVASDVTLSRSGVIVPGASSVEVITVPITPVSSDGLDSMDLLVTANAGETASYSVSQQSVTRDEPPCQADVNGDGVVDNGDIGAFITLFLAQDPSVDFTGDGVVDNGDIGAFIAAFLAGCQ